MNVNCTALTLTSCCWSSLNVNELLLGNPIVVMLLVFNTKNTVNPLTFNSSIYSNIAIYIVLSYAVRGGPVHDRGTARRRHTLYVCVTRADEADRDI